MYEIRNEIEGKTIRKLIGRILKLILFPFKQEKFLFHPDALPSDFKFTFKNKFKELSFQVEDNVALNGLLFNADLSQGLIFYLHGNFGTNAVWGNNAGFYLKNNYDFFILDYRGYGKSQSRISSEKKLYRDIQIVYDSLKDLYDEKNIIIIGYSIGTGFATYIASTNNPKMLILKAPFFSMIDLVHQYLKIIPSFVIKYKLRTNEYITNVKCPITIFHGNQDEVISIRSSFQLKKLFKQKDKLIILDGQRHDAISDNRIYQEELKTILK